MPGILDNDPEGGGGGGGNDNPICPGSIGMPEGGIPELVQACIAAAICGVVIAWAPGGMGSDGLAVIPAGFQPG